MRLHKNGHFDYLSRQVNLSSEKIAKMPREEIAAILIGCMIQKAMSRLNQQGLAVDYDSLPRSFFSHIARHFELRVSGPQGLAVMETSKYYSKDKQFRLFESDIHEKRENASPAIKAAAQKWAESYYYQLKNSQKGQ